MRPPRGAFAALDDGACTLTPQTGDPYPLTYSRVPPDGRRPHLEAEGLAVDTRPRFTFWKSDLAGDLTLGDSFTITAGPDAGTYSIDLIDDLDGETVEVVCQRR